MYNIIAYLTDQGNTLNEYRKRLTTAIEELEQVLTNDTVFSIYAFFNNGRISQLMLANNIEKTRTLLMQYKTCLKIIDKDEKERQKIIKSGFKANLINDYYKSSLIRNQQLLKYFE